MIEVTNLTKTYSRIVAVNNISFSIQKGEIVGFLGPNGAGKTTTMRMLTSFLAPTRGTVEIGGFDAVRESLQLRRIIGYLPENNPLYMEMRVREYLLFRAKLKKVPSSDRKMSVDKSLERCGLRTVKNRIIGHLSKGFRQRVGLADAITHNPQVLILDEPTAGLDPNQIRDVRTMIREMSDDRTILLSTHILSEIESVCDRSMIIDHGQIVASGTVKEITGRVKTKPNVVLEVRGSIDDIQKVFRDRPEIKNAHGRNMDDYCHVIIMPAESGDIRPLVHRIVREQQWELRELRYENLSLEEAFVVLTSGTGDVL